MTITNLADVLAGSQRLAADAKAAVPASLEASLRWLAKFLKEKETEKSALEAEQVALAPRIQATDDLAARARQQIGVLEEGRKRLTSEYREANDKQISDLRRRLSEANREMGDCLQGVFPCKTWQQAKETPGAKEGAWHQHATRWEELETKVIPKLREELEALENPSF